MAEHEHEHEHERRPPDALEGSDSNAAPAYAARPHQLGTSDSGTAR
jgi:hypothetical protein